MKILVIGGNGFIGSKVSHALFKKGHKVTIFDIKKDKKDKQIKFILGDIRNLQTLSKAISGERSSF